MSNQVNLNPTVDNSNININASNPKDCLYRLPCGTCMMIKAVCPHVSNNVIPDVIYKSPLTYQMKDFTPDIPDSCIRCPNHPINGGSGICNCTLGQKYDVTC